MLPAGLVIDGYRIDGLIGRGAMGEVYRAMQLSLKRPVAVKRIAAHLLEEPQAVARFEREAQCIARVQSQHVVAVYDFGQHTDSAGEQHWLLVMELVDGGAALGRVLTDRGGRLDWRTASSIILQVTEGLAAAGEFGVVHRDIKPDNILITRNGVAKLTDFGLAKSSDSSAMTASNAVLGTPLYMPPEACRGAEVDARGDLYSLGCTWFHCLAGRPPFRAASSIALLRAHSEDPIPDVRQFAPETPLVIAELVTRLLAKKADQRPASARQLITLIEGLAAQGIALPRSVPEVLGAEALQSTAITRVANDPTAATLLPGTESAGTADTRQAAATAATMVPTVPRKRWPLFVIALVVLAIAVGAVAALRRDDPYRGVHEALANGDPELALQRAEVLLKERPDDARAATALRESIQAEMVKLCDAGRYADARKHLADHRSRNSWLDIGAWRRAIDVGEAGWLAKHDRNNEAIDLFFELRKASPDDLALCRAVLDTLAEKRGHENLVINAANDLAERGTGPLEPAAVAVLTRYLANDSPFGEYVARLRKTLLRRHPGIVDTVRPWLDAAEYEKRCQAALLLRDAGQLSDGEEIRHHLRHLVELTSSYGTATESLDWLTAESAKPGWKERLAAARIPPFASVVALTSENEHADAVVKLLATAFREEITAPAIAWTGDEDQSLRWNAFMLLDAAGLLGRIDERAFHATSLTTFTPIFEPRSFTRALAWCAARSGTPEAAAARAMLNDCVKHITANIAEYDQGNPQMQKRAIPCRERLKQVEQARDAIQ